MAGAWTSFLEGRRKNQGQVYFAGQVCDIGETTPETVTLRPDSKEADDVMVSFAAIAAIRHSVERDMDVIYLVGEKFSFKD